MNIAVVYLGKKLPRYVSENIKYIRNNFSNINIYFVTDNFISSKKIQKIKGINTFVAKKDSDFSLFSNQTTHNLEFRDGFWKHTFNRFFALRELISEINLRDVVQIEADVLMNPSFNFEKFMELEIEIAFPLETIDKGAASFLFVKDLNSLDEFLEFSRKSINSVNSETDMTLLGKYHRAHPEKTFILPTFVNFTENSDLDYDYSTNYKFFNSIFDSTTLGLFLVGRDPRNSRGWSKINFTDPGHLVDFSKVTFIPVKQSFPLIDFGNQRVEINCIHVHSKELKYFRNPIKSLNRAVKRIEGKERYEFHLLVFLQLSGKFLRRHLTRRKIPG